MKDFVWVSGMRRESNRGFVLNAAADYLLADREGGGGKLSFFPSTFDPKCFRRLKRKESVASAAIIIIMCVCSECGKSKIGW